MSKKADAKEKRYAKQAEKKARKEAEQEAKERARREAEEAKEKAKREAEEAKEEAQRAKEAEKKARKEAEQEAKERARREAEEAKEKAIEEAEQAAKEKISAELYKGMMKLAIMSPVGYDEMRELEEYLRQVQELRLVLVGGSVEEGIKIVISAEKPIPLLNVLREMPPIERVVKKGKEIQVTLKVKQ